jgi:recombinational DNA repair protein RecR
MDKAKIGAALAALRKTSWHFCASCGKRFSGISQAKFCSNACRQKAKYAKVKAARDQTEPP